MYGKFSVGYRIIPEKATVIPQFQQTSLEDEYNVMQPTYVSTLPGTTEYGYPYSKVHVCDPGITDACIIPLFLLMKEIYWNQCQVNKQGLLI